MSQYMSHAFSSLHKVLLELCLHFAPHEVQVGIAFKFFYNSKVPGDLLGSTGYKCTTTVISS